MDNCVCASGVQVAYGSSLEQDQFQCSLFAQNQQTLLLCEASVSFFQRFHVPLGSKGKNVLPILRNSLKFLTDLFWQDEFTSRSFCYFAELEDEDENNSFWEITLESVPPFLHLMAHKRSPKQIIERYCIEDSVNISSFYAKGHQSMLLTPDGKGNCAISSCNDAAASLYRACESLSAEHIGRMSFLRSTRLLECCEEGQSLCLYDTFPNQDGIGRSFVRMLCLPVEQGKQKTFLILGVFCSALEFFQRYERGGNHDKSGFDDCTYPVAVFSFSGDGPVPVSFNRCCSEILSKGFSIPELLHSDAVLRSFRSGVPCTASAQISGNLYEISALPIMHDNNSGKIMITIVPAQQTKPVERVVSADRLTPREEQTLTLAAQGYSNRYIAHKLDISEGTVKKLIYNGYQKLGISSRVELCRMVSSQPLTACK